MNRTMARILARYEDQSSVRCHSTADVPAKKEEIQGRILDFVHPKLNHKNIAGYQYNSAGTKDIVYQYAFFPVGGVNIEF